MKFYIWYTTAKYDPYELIEIDAEKDMLDFLNERAGNPDFAFRIVRGQEMKVAPVSTATKYILVPGQ